MNRFFFLAFLPFLSLLAVTGAFGAPLQTLNVDRYAWEFPAATNIPAAPVASLKAELVTQIEDIVEAGSLTPWRVNHADEHTDAYFVYLEPGRIITTLAWAYPHLDANRQATVKRYVRAQFQSEVFAPWNPGRLNAAVAGTRREFHPINRVGNWTPNWQATRPTIQSLYGLWLWAYRAGDFDDVRPHWDKIKACYNAKLSQGGIYSTMNAHVAMIRLAEAFKDMEMKQAAWQNLSNNLQMGLAFKGDPGINTDESRMSQVEKNTVRLYAKNNNGGLYWPKQNGSIYRGMMFLSISPEIGRYLFENVREEMLKRHAYGKARFPLGGWSMRLTSNEIIPATRAWVSCSRR